MKIFDQGSGDPTVLLVHGFTCDSSDWTSQIAALSSRHRVIACDLPGHGGTPGAPSDCSVEAYGADLAGLIEAQGLSDVIIVAHSMGCRFALQTYLNVAHRVAGIVLLDGSYAGAGDRSEIEQSMTQRLAGGGYEEFMRVFFEQMFLPTSDPALRDAILARAFAFPAEAGRALFSNTVGWDAANMIRALDSVEVPVLVVQFTTLNYEHVRVALRPGETSPWTELVRARIPSAKIEVLPGNGHFGQLESPEAVSSLISTFVDEL